MLIIILILAILLFIWYTSFKGMCRWVERDNPAMFFLKWFANALSGGVVGIVMFFVRGSDCAGLTEITTPKLTETPSV